MTKSNPFRDRIEKAAQEGYVNGTRRTFSNRPVPGVQGRYYADTVKATTKQIALISTLLTERDLATETRPKFAARLAQLVALPSEIDNLDIKQASALIEYLFGLPNKPKPKAETENTSDDEFAMIPAGRYAVTVNGELMFVQVDRPESGKWAGRVFVKRQAGSELHRMYASVQRRVLNAIATQGPATCSAAYGHELGRCGVCHRELTNEESRAIGIGPICRDKNGW